MNLILSSILITLAVLAVGGSAGYILWIKMRPKKETWVAEVWEASDTIQRYPRNKEGEIISKMKLRDMRFLGFDTYEKVIKKQQEVYRLQKIKKSAGPVLSGTTYRRGGKTFVRIIKIGETYTTFKAGYSEDIGKAIIKPMPYSRMNLIETNIIEKESRQKEKKSTLEALTPWVVTGMLAFSIVAIAYFTGGAFIKISQSQAKTMREVSDSLGNYTTQLANVQAVNIELLRLQQKKDMQEGLGPQPANNTT